MWTPGKRGSPPETAWPPVGLTLTASFSGAAATALEGLRVDVIYEMYAGSAALSKWVSVSAAPGSAAAGLVVDGVQVRRKVACGSDWAPDRTRPWYLLFSAAGASRAQPAVRSRRAAHLPDAIPPERISARAAHVSK